MLIDDKRLELALKRLAETDERMAELRMEMERAEFKAKATREAVFLRSEGSVAERSALATTSTIYAEAMNLYFDALRSYEHLRNTRAKEVLVIECWRSMSSARTKGMIT